MRNKNLIVSRIALAILAFSALSPISGAWAGPQYSVLFAIDLIRHGDRTPILDIPTTPHPWPSEFGTLTPIGQDQQRELGKKVRDEYISTYQILPPHYEPNSIHVRSTNFQRTILSAKSFLEGLYSKPEASVIPIETPKKEHDPLLVPFSQHSINELQSLLERSGEKAKNLGQILKAQLPGWRKSTGLSLKSADEMMLLGDNLFIRNIHQIPLPKSLKPSDIEAIQNISRTILVENCSTNPAYIQMGRKFLKTVARSIDDAVKNKTQQKVQLYFAHDATILGITAALGARQKTVPPYASRLNFLVKDSSRGPIVQISLNGNTAQPSTCKTEGCTLAELQKIADLDQI